MEYVQLGQTGVRVSPLCLGTYNFGGPTPREESVRIIREALDAGINFVDTANAYHTGGSEEVVGEALAGRRDDVVLATKVHQAMGPDPNDWGNSRRAVRREVEASLRRLGTDWIDLYQLHRPDPTTPLEATLRALSELVVAGKVRYVGFSNFPAWQLTQARWIADRHGLEPVATEQPPYNLLERRIEDEVLPACRELGIGILAYSPLAMGILTDRYLGGDVPEDARATQWFGVGRPGWEDVLEAVGRLAKIAGEAGTTLARLAHAWVLAREGVTSTIVGPRTAGHLGECLGSLDVEVTGEMLRAVDDVVPPGASMWIGTVRELQRRAARDEGS